VGFRIGALAAGLGAAALLPAVITTSGASGTAEDEVAMLDEMTLEEKVGQLFVVEVFGQDATDVTPAAAEGNRALYGVDTPAEVIDKYRPGGVVYFDARRGPDNLLEPRQIAALSNGLQAAALRQPSPIPLLIATDQEGGAVVYRLSAPATAMPGNMALGAGRSGDDARRSAEVIGSELAAIGINQNFAPVADVNVNPANPVIGVRSFGEDPALVSELVAAQVDGYHAAGIAAVAKHFPGHGDTATDSHFGLPEVTHTRDDLEAIDLPPFEAAIEGDVDAIMTAHVVLRSVDSSGPPATMSAPILTGLLRDQLGFDGLIVTDALDMGGATSTFPPDVAPVRAIQAGADQLLLAPQLDVAFGAVLEAVRNGEIPERRLDESVTRILRLKERLGLIDDPYVDVDGADAAVGRPDHVAVAQEIADRTITLVRNDAGLLPLDVERQRVLVTGRDVAANLLAEAFARRGRQVTSVATGGAPIPADVLRAVGEAGSADVVIVATADAGLPTESAEAQRRLVRGLLRTVTPVIVVAVRTPYDLASFPDDVSTYLATYGDTPASIEALVRVLIGEVDPVGVLPVTIPRADGTGVLYPYGHGLSDGGG
jgi:beta-N-acetylhexosaminidase